ncbi:MAG: T9SS type A sorting domain-containing protein [Bacteroidota bacterium]
MGFYFNPTKGLITLEGSPLDWQTLQVYEVKGQLANDYVQWVEEGPKHLILDLSQLPKGIYLFEIDSKTYKMSRE